MVSLKHAARTTAFLAFCIGLNWILLGSPLAVERFGVTTVDDHSITLMAGATNLEGQAGWSYYNSGDAPEGGYFTWLFAGTPSVKGVITLPTSLAAGRYSVFFKGYDYDGLKTIQATLGGGVSAPVPLNDRDGNGAWTDPLVIDAGSSASSLEFTIFRNNSVAGDQRYLLKGLYITSNAQEAVNKFDVVVNLTYPTVMDDSPAIKGNLVVNSGFETGIGADWGFQSGGVVPGNGDPVNTMWDPTQGHDSQGCMKLLFNSPTANTAKEVISRLYHVKPNKKYTLSLWVKSQTGVQGAAVIGLENPYIPPPGFPPQASIRSNVVYFNDTWTRLSVSGYLVSYPSSDYQIIIDTGGANGTYILVDDVQLEEGDLTDYTAASELEAGVYIDTPGHVLYSDEPLSAKFMVRNNASGPRSGVAHYEIYDFMNRIVNQGSVAPSVPARTTQTSTLSLATGGRTGVFRLVTWIEDADRTEQEVVYSIIPRPPTPGTDLTSCLGIHHNNAGYQLQMLQRLGLKWNRAMSPAACFRWTVAEPTSGNFVWFDSDLALASSYGFTTMGTLGGLWPAWADNGGLPDLDKWQQFVSQLVSHYKPLVKYWEIWNEPDFTPTFYAQLLKRAVDAIELSDPDAKVIGMGGIGITYMQQYIQAIETLYPAWNWQQHVAALATHQYPGGAPEPFKPNIIDKYGVPVWNTESGAWCQGFYQGVNSNFTLPGKNLWPYSDASRFYNGSLGAPKSLIEVFLRTIASGQSKYFYYDSRYYADPSFTRNHPTILEYDGTPRPKGVAYALAGSLVDHSTGLGDVSTDPNAFVLIFDKPNAPVAALISKDNHPRQLSLALSQVRVLDMMGNPMPVGGSIPFGRLPVYIQGVGITAATLKAALQVAPISARPDTDAPSVSISDGPRGPLAQGSFRMRWIAMDDTSFPNAGEVNPETGVASDVPNPFAILYRYQLQGSSVWSAWVTNTTADYSGVPQGSYVFQVQAKDEAGNLSTIASRAIVVGSGGPPTSDTTPPTCAITFPATNATITGIVTVQVAASDNVGVTRVALTLNGSPLGETTTPPFALTWDSRSIGAGSGNLVARAYDAAGNVGTSTSVYVTINNSGDTVPPTASISSPTNGSTVSGNVSVPVAALDNVGVTRVELYLDGSLLIDSTTAPYTFTWYTTSVADGAHTLLAKAYDAAGNVGVSGGVTTTVRNAPPADTTGPTIAFVSPLANQVVGGRCAVSVNATDPSGVQKVELYVNGALKSSDTASPWTFSLNTKHYQGRTITLTARGYDSLGNSADASISVTVK